MSAHRRHYLQLQPTGRHTAPTADDRQAHPEPSGAVFVVRVVVICMAAIALLSGLLLLTKAPATSYPVRSSQVQVYPLEPLTPEQLAQARLEGFRAGQLAARDDGCTQPLALTSPIGTR
jgi:hypothetical protein